MNFSWKKRKHKPLILWIRFFTALVACTSISAMALGRLPLFYIFFIYSYMFFPILHLLLFVKPLMVYEVLHIVFSDLMVLTSIVLTIWDNIWCDIPSWLYSVSVGFCAFMLVLFFFLDIAAHWKHRNEYRERYLREMKKTDKKDNMYT